ncbi:MAG: OmpA family protein [Candidatus Aenigmatarchaeota archaeon]
MRKYLILIGVFLFISTAFPQFKDINDHPAIKRYDGSELVDYKRVEFVEFYLPLGDVSSFDWYYEPQEKRDKELERLVSKKLLKRLEGRLYYYVYLGPKGRSTFEVYKNYEKALLDAGYIDVYKEIKNQRSLRRLSGFFEKVNRLGWGSWADPETNPWYYISVRSPKGDVYIAIAVAGTRDEPRTVLYILEAKEMELGLASAELKSAEILNQLKSSGHVSIYGIYFDFDKADIKPESEPTLREIAKFLKENPHIKLYVVGHTDNIGKIEYNMELSKRRAEAVVKELIERYGISKERLRAFGVGPLAPVSSNSTEEGRAKNRRVELVEQ